MIENWLMVRKQVGRGNTYFSGNRLKSSGAPRISVLGSAIHIVHINDLAKGTKHNISKSADNNDVDGIINCDEVAKWLYGTLDCSTCPRRPK